MLAHIATGGIFAAVVGNEWGLSSESAPSFTEFFWTSLDNSLFSNSARIDVSSVPEK